MKGNFLGILAIFFASILGERYNFYAALSDGTILAKCGCAACEHHDNARTCARTAAMALGKYFRQVDKKCSGENNKKWLAIIIFVAKI